MKILPISILFLCIAEICSAAQTMTSGTIVALRNHTLNYYTTTLQGVSILQLSTPFTAGCSWVFLSPNDKNALAVALTAEVSGSPVSVYYDPAVTSPWGDPTTCGVVAIEIDQ